MRACLELRPIAVSLLLCHWLARGFRRREIAVGCSGGKRSARYVTAQKLADAFAQALDREVALNGSGGCDADVAGFFGDDDHNRICLFRDSDACAMTRPELRGKLRVGGEREEACRRSDAVLLDDDGAVVQRSVLEKDGGEQIVRQIAVDSDAAVNVVAEVVLALDDNECASPILGE